MLQGMLRLGLMLAASAAVLAVGLKRSDEPSLACARAGAGGDDYEILVVGESWASDGKVFPELPQTVSDRLGGRSVQACSLGFAGRNSRHLYFELKEKFPKEKLYALYGERKPDKVILMTGVNDVIQHVGASSYVEYNKKIVEYFSDVADVEIITIPRVNEKHFKAPNLFSHLKRQVLRCVNDNCGLLANDAYRISLWRDHPELQLIEYDDFIEQFEGHEQCYTRDGVHLTDECYHKYGTFIGKATSLRKAAMRRQSGG